MELASMLAGEEFTDAPRCVDPVLGAFLRAFNDRLAPAERQRLLPYASAAVGTRGDRAVMRARRDRCLGIPAHARGARRAAARLAARGRVLVHVGAVSALRLRDGAGELAARDACAHGDVDGAFALLDELLRLGGHEPPVRVPPDAGAPLQGRDRAPVPA